MKVIDFGRTRSHMEPSSQPEPDMGSEVMDVDAGGSQAYPPPAATYPPSAMVPGAPGSQPTVPFPTDPFELSAQQQLEYQQFHQLQQQQQLRSHMEPSSQPDPVMGSEVMDVNAGGSQVYLPPAATYPPLAMVPGAPGSEPTVTFPTDPFELSAQQELEYLQAQQFHQLQYQQQLRPLMEPSSQPEPVNGSEVIGVAAGGSQAYPPPAATYPPLAMVPGAPGSQLTVSFPTDPFELSAQQELEYLQAQQFHQLQHQQQFRSLMEPSSQPEPVNGSEVMGVAAGGSQAYPPPAATYPPLAMVPGAPESQLTVSFPTDPFELSAQQELEYLQAQQFHQLQHQQQLRSLMEPSSQPEPANGSEVMGVAAGGSQAYPPPAATYPPLAMVPGAPGSQLTVSFPTDQFELSAQQELEYLQAQQFHQLQHQQQLRSLMEPSSQPEPVNGSEVMGVAAGGSQAYPPPAATYPPLAMVPGAPGSQLTVSFPTDPFELSAQPQLEYQQAQQFHQQLQQQPRSHMDPSSQPEPVMGSEMMGVAAGGSLAYAPPGATYPPPAMVPGAPGSQPTVQFLTYPAKLNAHQHLLEYQQAQKFHQPEQYLREFWASQMREIKQTTDFKSLCFSLSKIKRIMKADEDVYMIAAEVPVVFVKACEMFILELTLRSWMHTQEKRCCRTLVKNDIAVVIGRTYIYDFLVDLYPTDDKLDELLGLPRVDLPPTPGLRPLKSLAESS